MKKKTLLFVATCAFVLTACGTTEGTISDDQTSEVQSEDSMSADVPDVETDQETTLENEAKSTETETTQLETVSTETTSTEAGVLDVVVEDEVAVETFYSAATTIPAGSVESYAMDIKDMVLNGDWKTFVNEISYPIIVDGLTMEDATDMKDYIADSKVSADFLAAIEAETCIEMFNSVQGIMMGIDGQIWLGTVQGENGDYVLKVVEINNMFEQ